MKNFNIKGLLALIVFNYLFTNISESSELKVPITYVECGQSEPKTLFVDLPTTSAFVHNDFKAENIYLRYQRTDNLFKLDNEISDIKKVYSREAVRLVKQYLINKVNGATCLDIHVDFNFKS